MKNKTIIIYDVVKEAGLSTATVSRVIVGNYPVAYKKVNTIIDKYDFYPNAVQRGAPALLGSTLHDRDLKSKYLRMLIDQ